ncbi:MAG: PHP domain-containing protein [Chloroflexota bacterium]
MIDLHMHTHYSDGRPSPEELVRHAAEIGLQVIAITDHDNVRGSIEARPYAKELGITLIPAVEITTHWQGMGSVDVLGYFPDFADKGFQNMLDIAMSDLRERITMCCDILTKDGYPVNYVELQERNPRYAGAVHVIHTLQEKGLVEDFADGLTNFIKAWKAVRPCILTTTDVIDTINRAGGVAVLAHPTRIRFEWLQADEIVPLVEAGLGGIEIHHPSLNDEARQHFMQIAAHLGLVISGGSDEHGYPQDFPRLGRQPVTYDMLEALRGRADENGQP